MKTLVILPALFLCSCMGFQYTDIRSPDGTVMRVVQVDATMAEGEASAREITHPSGLAMRSVQQRFDGTRVPIGAIDAAVAKVGLREAGQTTRNKDTLDGAVQLKGTKDPNVIPVDPNIIPANPNLPD